MAGEVDQGEGPEFKAHYRKKKKKKKRQGKWMRGDLRFLANMEVRKKKVGTFQE
jgi:hypothetical protein